MNYIRDTRGINEYLLKKYKTLKGIRYLLDSNTHAACKEFRKLIKEHPVFGLEVRSKEIHGYEIISKLFKPGDILYNPNPYMCILCKSDIPKISRIEDMGLGKGGLVILENETQLSFNSNNGFFMEDSSFEELLCDDNVTYILDMFLGGYYINSDGSFD